MAGRTYRSEVYDPRTSEEIAIDYALKISVDPNDYEYMSGLRLMDELIRRHGDAAETYIDNARKTLKMCGG